MTFAATVVIATRDRRDELRRAVRSAIAQDLPIEVLVIDDGSRDGTPEMIRKEFPNVQLHAFEGSLGVPTRRNQAARLARAPIIFSIDDDAEFSSPNTLKQTLREFNHYRIGAIALPFINISRNQEVHQRAPNADVCYITDTFIGTAYAVRRDCFLHVGGYREQVVHQGEEKDFCLRMLNTGYVVRLGRSDPIQHNESPKRNLRRMDFYGRRNDILFVWHNVPGPYLPIHLIATTLNGLIFAARTRSLIRFRDMLGGLIRGYSDCLKYFSARRPVTRCMYRLSRRLTKDGPLPLSEIENQLPPCIKVEASADML
jgi:glycosyltransferase involved in cell wall biosynthesis